MLRRFSHVRRGLSSAAPRPPPPPPPPPPHSPQQQPIRLVILDKDGTLVDNLGHFGAWATALGRRLGKAAATASAAATPTAGSSSGRSAAGRRSAAAVAAAAAAADGTALQHAASVECVEESQHDRESQHAASVEAELHRRFGLALSASGSSCEVQRGTGGALATTSTVGLQLTYTPLLGNLFPTHSSLLGATGARLGRAGQWHHAAAAGDCARGGGRSC